MVLTGAKRVRGTCQTKRRPRRTVRLPHRCTMLGALRSETATLARRDLGGDGADEWRRATCGRLLKRMAVLAGAAGRSSNEPTISLEETRRVRTTRAAAPSKDSMAAPMAVSSWNTLGEDLSRGSTVLTFLIMGSGISPPHSSSFACHRSHHHRARTHPPTRSLLSKGVCAARRPRGLALHPTPYEGRAETHCRPSQGSPRLPEVHWWAGWARGRLVYMTSGVGPL